jgi:hypothetical protein
MCHLHPSPNPSVSSASCAYTTRAADAYPYAPFLPPSRHSGWPPAAAAHQPLCPIFSSTSYISIHHGPALLSARSIAYQTPAPLHNTTHHHTTLAESDVKLARWPLSPPQPPVPMADVSQVARRDCAWCLIYVRNLKNVFVGN